MRLGVVACKWTGVDSRLRPVVLNSGRLRRPRSGPSGQSGEVKQGVAISYLSSVICNLSFAFVRWTAAGAVG